MRSPHEPDPIEEVDKPFSHWDDINLRIRQSLWEDVVKRNTLFFSLALMVLGAIMSVFE